MLRPGHLRATAGHCRARPAGKMRTPRANTAACPPRVTAKEDSTSHAKCLAKPVLAGGAKAGGCLAQEQPSCSRDLSPPSPASCQTQGPPGLPGIQRELLCLGFAQLGPATCPAFPSTPPPTPALRNSPEGQARLGSLHLTRTMAESGLVTRDVLGGREEVGGQRGPRDPALPGPRGRREGKPRFRLRKILF